MIVVTGATGNVGRVLVRLLAEAGEPVTAVSRSITGADVPAGVRTVPVDLADAESFRRVLERPGTEQLRPAAEGPGNGDARPAEGSADRSNTRPVEGSVDALFLCPAGELLASAGSPSDLIKAIKQAGVRHVVLLSSQASQTRPRAVSHRRAREFEQLLKDSGLSWTILRPGGFASNTYAYISAIRSDRTVIAPFGDVGLPLVDPADVAEVAFAALRGERHAGRAYTLTGPSLVSPRQQAAAIGTVLDIELGFAELTREQALTTMVAFMPEAVAEGTLDILGAPTSAELAISPDVEKVLGRAPRSYSEWVQRNAAAFR